MTDIQSLEVTTSRGANLKFCGPKDDHIINEMSKFKKVYESEMLEYIAQEKLAGAYLDIGANLGTHGIFFAKLPWASEVHYFEPNPKALKFLEKNIKENGITQKSELHPIGLGSMQAYANINEDLKDNLGAVSLQTTNNGRVRVEVLDEIKIKKKIAVMTIDVEGFETEVLKGAVDTISRNKPRLFIEAKDNVKLSELREILEPIGYKVKNKFNYTPTYEFKYSWLTKAKRAN